MKINLTLFLLLSLTLSIHAQSDNFEGDGNITTWFGDDCLIDPGFANPEAGDGNASATVLRYQDTGGDFANVRFEVDNNFDLNTDHAFSFKIFIPSAGLSGNQTNQVSLKLQNGTLPEPWSTQTEIIKPVDLDVWQTVTFDFAEDAFINLDPNSPPPTSRVDFNRVVIQVNGENNNDQVLAYIDDFLFTAEPLPEPEPECLIWADEFNGNGPLDEDRWFHQTQLPLPDSWFNGEIQHYTDRLANTFQDDGMLNMVAKREQFTDQGVTKSFTSARLNSKFAFTYGRVEIRAKLPTGVGTWPALWMLGQNINEDGAYWDNEGFGTTSWPACGEIDIMEHWGDNQNYVSSAMHTPSSFGGTVNVGGTIIPTASTAFHVYEMDWNEERIQFSVDGVVHYTYNPSTRNSATWPFDAPQYLLFNIAMLPNVSPSFTSSTMEVDYVRIYQPCTTSTPSRTAVEELSFFPNPVSEELTLTLPSAVTGDMQLRLINAKGQIVRQQVATAAGATLTVRNLTDLQTGVYFLVLEAGGKVYQLKFVKG